MRWRGKYVYRNRPRSIPENGIDGRLTPGASLRIVDGVPTYEYRCKACEREFEIQQRMSDPDLVHCDACGADALERLISWTSVRNNNWQAALRADNPKEAFKGISAVDRSRYQRFGAKTDATTGTPPTGTPATDPAAAGAAPRNTGDTLDEDDDDATGSRDDKPGE